MHFLLAAAMLFLSVSLQAQDLKSDTVKVDGVCKMCKAKIEKAAMAAGATSAVWDTETKILAVSFPATESSMSKIERSVADAGYDTQNEKATPHAYGKLDKCCRYPRKTLQNQ